MATRAPSLSNSCAAASPISNCLPPVIRIFLFASLLIVVTPCAPVETGIGVENESLRKPRTTTLCSREVGRGRSVRPYPWVHAPPLWLRLDPVGLLRIPPACAPKPFAEPLRQLSANDSDMGSGKMSSSSFSTPSKMARATDSGEALGTLKPRAASVSTGPVRTA